MSYLGSREQAKKDAMAADMQIDGLDPASTSPVRDGSNDAGGAPMQGKKEFSTERTRHGWVGNQNGTRREFPSEGVTRK